MESNSLLYIAYDADDAGKKIGRAILADDPDQLKQDSDRIELGNEIIAEWADKWGGVSYSSGGDQGLFSIPREALEEIEELRNDYQFATNLTMTIGVGATLSEAGKALLVGKFRGKNMVVQYDANIEKEIDQAQKNVEEGNASSEERKLSEAYLKPENNGTKPPEEQLMDYADAKTSPPQIEKPDPKKTPKQEMNNIMETRSKNNHPGDDDKDIPQNNKEDARERAVESNDQPAAEKHSEAAMRAIAEAIEGDEKPGQTEKDKLRHVDDEDMADTSGEMEENTSRPDGYKDQNVPGDMGLNEEDAQKETPDLSSVLKDGLDSHADNMQREKVVNMVSKALEGFKANKHILEKAKEKAPELYGSCLAMLQAMIEMTKMLGLGQEESDEQNPLGEQSPDAGAPPQAETQQSDYAPETTEQEEASAYQEPTVFNDEQQADEHDEDNCPYCKDPGEEHDEESCPYCQDPEEECPHCAAMEEQAAGKEKPEAEPSAKPEKKKPAAPSEGAAPSPKTAGQ